MDRKTSEFFLLKKKKRKGSLIKAYELFWRFLVMDEWKILWVLFVFKNRKVTKLQTMENYLETADEGTCHCRQQT